MHNSSSETFTFLQGEKMTTNTWPLDSFCLVDMKTAKLLLWMCRLRPWRHFSAHHRTMGTEMEEDGGWSRGEIREKFRQGRGRRTGHIPTETCCQRRKEHELKGFFWFYQQLCEPPPPGSMHPATAPNLPSLPAASQTGAETKASKWLSNQPFFPFSAAFWARFTLKQLLNSDSAFTAELRPHKSFYGDNNRDRTAEHTVKQSVLFPVIN